MVYPFGYDTSMATMNDSPLNTTFSVRNSHYHRRTFVLTESQLFDANRYCIFLIFLFKKTFCKGVNCKLIFPPIFFQIFCLFLFLKIKRFGWQIKVAADDFVIDLYVNGIAINFQGLIGAADFNGQSEVCF